MSKLEAFYNDPFSFMDGLKPSFKGHIFNPFLKFKLNRRLAFSIAVICFAAWMILGFDSTPLQFIHVLYEGIPALVLGKASFNDLVVIYNNYYGKEMHYSAFVIYGLMYWFLSRHFEKHLGIVKSKNVTYSCALTFLSIALFEFYWMGSFAHFQNQSWVITPKWPQLRIHLQNTLFATVGVLGTLYMFLDSYLLDAKGQIVKCLYKFRFNKIALGLTLLSVALGLCWLYYPGYVERINVTLETGEVWSNSPCFPQTLYTIDLNPTDNVNAGVWFFVENNWIHGLNTLVKAVWTLTICYVGTVKKVN